jgi:hypothetical protein
VTETGDAVLKLNQTCAVVVRVFFYVSSGVRKKFAYATCALENALYAFFCVSPIVLYVSVAKFVELVSKIPGHLTVSFSAPPPDDQSSG